MGGASRFWWVLSASLAGCGGGNGGSITQDEACALTETWLANNAPYVDGVARSDLPFGLCHSFWTILEDRAAGVTVNTNYTDGGDFVGAMLDCYLTLYDQGWQVTECIQPMQ